MVSVIIPTYNRANVIKKAIDSVLNQTYENLELIIVDDCSTDNTREIVGDIDDPRIKYVCLSKNSGACAARNKGIDMAKGQYIAFQDSDDEWLPSKLEKQLSVFEEHNPDIVFCKLKRIQANGQITFEPPQIKGGKIEKVTNLFGIGTQAIIAKRDVFAQLRFDDELPRFQDFELLLRASKQFSLYCLDEGLVNYEVGADSISSSPTRMYEACEKILKKHPDFKDYPEMIEHMAHGLLTGANSLRNKHTADYKKFVDMALEISQSRKVILKAVLIKLNLYSFLKKVLKKD